MYYPLLVQVSRDEFSEAVFKPTKIHRFGIFLGGGRELVSELHEILLLLLLTECVIENLTISKRVRFSLFLVYI